MKLFIALLSLVSSYAMADQCAYTDLDTAKRAELLLTDATVVELCEPCGESRNSITDKSFVKARSTTVNLVDAERKWYELSVNGKPVDLAYTFVQVSSGRLVNVAKVIGCEARNVSSAIRLK